MADDKQEFTNETGELVTLYNGRPVSPGQTVSLSEREVQDNQGHIDSGTLTGAAPKRQPKEAKNDE